MAYEQRDLSGSLFKNDRREKDTHPNLTGTIMIGGQEYWLSGWTKEKGDGEKWISLAAKPKEARTGNGTPAAAPAVITAADLDDDIPFITSDPRFG